jgi:hypothetical protein
MAQSASTNFPDKPIRMVVGYGLGADTKEGGDTKEQISDYSDAEII